MAVFENDRHTGLFGLGMSPASKPEHKIIIRKLILAFMSEIDENEFEIMFEWNVDYYNRNSLQPDIIIFNSVQEAVLIMEITTSNLFEKTIEKVKQLQQQYLSIKEIFVYDYEKKRWYSNTNSASKSELFNFDFTYYVF